MYFKDLSPYSYLQPMEERGKPVVNIGWLDDEHEFPIGDCPELFLVKLKELVCLYPQNETLGSHSSPFIEQNENWVKSGDLVLLYPKPYLAYHLGKEYRLGSAEIHVESPSKVYVAPDLVYHYVADCRYLPPDEFVQAVMDFTYEHE